jgi:GNAT superfamily N-acetyltransferase
MDIIPRQTEAEIRACFPAMHELRPHLTEDAFVAQVKRQMENHGYALMAASEAGRVVAVAGYRVAEHLAWGRVLYVDDLVTPAASRKSGFGGALLDWLIARARQLGCAQFHLDSGVVRHDAHRLYLSRKLTITSHHFALKLD